MMLLERRKAKLRVGQIAGGIGRPEVAGERLSPHPRPAAAEVEERATGATPVDMGPAVPEPGEQRLDRIAPYLPEGALPHAPQRVVGPELVGMRETPIVHVGDGEAS